MSEVVEAKSEGQSTKPYPSAAAGWTLVVFLTIAYIFSFIDRYILGLLVEPIKAEFALDDIQIGWLLSAFTIIYGVVGIFMGWLIDRGKRMWIVAIGVAVWSAATVATGMAKNFVQLFIARMTVGVGEATLSPATFSMIGDSFPPERRAKPIAFYSSALPVGAGIASLVSAGIIAWAASGSVQSLPLFGELSPWRFTLVVVGLPGLLLAIAFLLLKEPLRRSVPKVASSDSEPEFSAMAFLKANFLWHLLAIVAALVLVVAGAIYGYVSGLTVWFAFMIGIALGFTFVTDPKKRPYETQDGVVDRNGFLDALFYLRDHIVLFAGVILIVCCMTAIAYSQGLLPSTFERTWGWSPQKYALINGIALLIIGPLNMMIFGSLTDKMSAKGILDAPLKILCIGFAIMVPTAVVPYFMPTAEIAYAVLCINTVGIGIVSAIGVTALLGITPPQIRGQIIALYYFAISQVGSLGPISTGYLSNLVYGEENIRYAVATVPVIFAVLPLLLMATTLKRYKVQLTRVEGD